jgi:hypothetical protein
MRDRVWKLGRIRYNWECEEASLKMVVTEATGRTMRSTATDVTETPKLKEFELRTIL